eukprot:gene8120-8959_t
MSERPSLEEIYILTKGSFWYRKWNWCSEERHGLWEGVTVDKGGHLRTLDLRQNNLQGSLESVQYLSSLINLEVLVLSSNTLSGSIPPTVGKLTALVTLDLSWNKLTGSIPSELYSLHCLQVLRLDNNKLSGEISNALAQLPKLVHLDLSRNEFTGCVPDVGHRLLYLRVLDFSGNHFQGYVPNNASEFREMHARFLSF